jgi:hypothetical protein
MEHRDQYGECEWRCVNETRVDEQRVRAAARRLREDRNIAPHLADFGNIVLFELVSRYVRKHELPESVPEEIRPAITARLQAEERAGQLGTTHQVPGPCMLYAQFRRRYGPNRAYCMRGHGNWHGRPEGPW